MTYASRRTRIIVSRWTDECDAENTLRACRKRSDGRLKKFSSCDDPRAWINDNCIKNEYLVDLMSDGEFLGKPPFRLYGRFIPVPILFKLAQSSVAQNGETESSEKQRKPAPQLYEKYTETTVCGSNSKSANSNLENDSSLTRVQWEKNVLEKSLFKCTCLLSKALVKLEKIDDIVDHVNVETDEHRRNTEIQETFYKSKLNCTPSQHRSSSDRSSLHNFPENVFFSKANMKKLKDSSKCTELLRKISGLREKLRKIQICRLEIINQIQISERKAQKCSSYFQVTELYSRREQAQVKILKKKYEKLIAERGKLLSEMCQALTSLNAIKKYSRSCLKSRKRNSRPKVNCDDFRREELQESGECNCGWKFSDNLELSDSEKFECSESSSADSDLNKKFDKFKETDRDLDFDYQTSSTEFPLRSSVDCRNLGLERLYEDNLNSPCAEAVKMDSKFSGPKSALPFKNSEHYRQLASSHQKKNGNSLKEEKNVLKTSKKSKVKFICEESLCRKKLHADDLSVFENSLTPEQKMVIMKTVQNVQSMRTLRPSTSPTTKRERQAVSLDCKHVCRNLMNAKRYETFGNVPERRSKSETTMKEIEKTLRNYEQRLCDMESLECKVEELKEQSSEVCRLREKLANLKTDTKKQRAADRENFSREITRLCSENWELKKQIEQLTTKFNAQSHKIQNLKCVVIKARELECETEELKKELTEYRDSFEHQRKCNSEWESVVAMQRTEIENLMNHIRKLTTMKEEAPCSPFQDKRYIQRSRSYSPEKIKERFTTNRPKTQVKAYRPFSEEEEVSCCCGEYWHSEGKRKNPLRSSDRDCYFPQSKNVNWCN